MNRKRIVSLLLVFIFALLSAQSVLAADRYPVKAWNDFSAAKNAGNEQNIIIYGQQVIDFFKNTPISDEYRLGQCTAVYKELALIYEKRYDYTKATEMWKAYIELTTELERQKKWDHWARLFAEAKIKSYEASDLKVYYAADVAYAKYYGAKFEPKAGLYFGKVLQSYQSFTQDKQNSAILTYTEYGDAEFVFPNQSQHGLTQQDSQILLMAWNIPEKAQGYEKYGILAKIPTDTEYITKMAKALADYKKPVFLRFGAEMDVWEPLPDAELFKKAFITVANIMRKNAPNVAMVWSPCDLTSAEVDVTTFYPGDEYVDWVGMSSYNPKYFRGNKNADDATNTQFFTGPYVNPIGRMKKIVELYGDRKPIMIAEGGIAHTTTATGETYPDWAAQLLLEEYAYLPIVYPQVKAIFHFDHRLSYATPSEWYDLYTQPALQKAYNQAVNNPMYLSRITDTAKNTYLELKSNTFSKPIELYSYAALPNMTNKELIYLVNGKEVSRTSTAPYYCSVDLSKFGGEGWYTITVKVNEKGVRTVSEKSVKVYYKPAAKTSFISEPAAPLEVAALAEEYTADGLTAEENAITTEPFMDELTLSALSLAELKSDVTFNGSYLRMDMPVFSDTLTQRSMVPIRPIFEALGVSAEDIEYDSENERLTVTHPDGTVMVFVLNTDYAYVNYLMQRYDTPARMVGDWIYVPLRFICENLGAAVSWNEIDKVIEITLE